MDRNQLARNVVAQATRESAMYDHTCPGCGHTFQTEHHPFMRETDGRWQFWDADNDEPMGEPGDVGFASIVHDCHAP